MLFFQPITGFPVPVLSIAQARHPVDYATLQALPTPPRGHCLGYGADTALSPAHEYAGATVRWQGGMVASRSGTDHQYPATDRNDTGKEQRHILAAEGRLLNPDRIGMPSG